MEMECDSEGGTPEEEFIPRNYQVQLMQVALKENTIIFLPTGAGKTYIAVLVMKQMTGDLQRPYSEGGKLTFLLVNTVALVNQHSEYLRRHVPFEVADFSGEKKVDFYEQNDWLLNFNKYQIFVMTSQIFLNIVNSNFIDMNKINLIIFDECHRGVNDHSMRNIMMNFSTLTEPPRVIGLTATLLNGNCKPGRVMEEVFNLETTFHSKVATVDDLQHIVGYSTNPTENVKLFKKHNLSALENSAIEYLLNMASILRLKLNIPRMTSSKLQDLKPLDPEDSLTKIRNIIMDAITHIEMLGTFGGSISILAHMIQIERLKLYNEDKTVSNILNAIMTSFVYVRHLFETAMKNESDKDKIYKYSSDKVKTLLTIFKEFKNRSKKDLSAIIFVQRRFTAKVIHFILQALKIADQDFDYVNSNFMVGFNTKPFNDTREGLYNVKQNFKVLEKFRLKEVNVLVASNVLEEGIDMPECSLVVKFDLPQDYRSYIQSKGRARHKHSFFYIMVEETDYPNFSNKYIMFQNMEQILNDFLVGKNKIRSRPTKSAIQKMYDEAEFAPYFVKGPGSAQINLLSAISLLCQYCNSLPADKYTVHSPEWYREDSTINIGWCRVVIVLPIICPILEPIKGPFCSNLKTAKRAAAYEACVMLHKIGEIDDNLRSKMKDVLEDDVNFLFEHWPSEKDKVAGTKKKRRIYPKQISADVKGQIKPNLTVFVHVIELTPRFEGGEIDADNVLKNLYTSSLCYGIVTAKPLPQLCTFPIYVSQGEISVELNVNRSTCVLSAEQILSIQGFHHLIFNDLLKILQTFLAFDNGDDSEMMVLVPVRKHTCEIDFAVIEEHARLKNSKIEQPHDHRVNLVVQEKDYVGKILAPWYRQDDTHYIVVKICTDLNALSEFPSGDFSTYANYYAEKYHLTSVNPTQPLLLVKALSKRLVCTKPRGVNTKRKRDMLYDEMEEHLVAEFCVKQEFPACLWLQATLLPTVLHHLTHLLQAEDLRRTISDEIKFISKSASLDQGDKWKPLELDVHLLTYKTDVMKDVVQERRNMQQTDFDGKEQLALPSSTQNKLNQDLAVKMFESKFPWKDIQEPKDIDRDLHVNATEIFMYEQFINKKVDASAEKVSSIKDNKMSSSFIPAITYDKNYEHKPLLLLQNRNELMGPELREIYKALATAKSNGIVNLERLETLGDSFLKLMSSLYIILKHPRYMEGQATTLKNRLISNKNLYYLGVKRNIPGFVQASDLSPKSEWLPPAFSVPKIVRDRIKNGELSINLLFNIDVPVKEQITGLLEEETENIILDCCTLDEAMTEETDPSVSLCSYLNQIELSDKTVADVVEALLGAYFQSNGFDGGIKFMAWMGIIPSSEDLSLLIKQTEICPVLCADGSQSKIDFHIPTWKSLEQTLGYHFNNRAYLLQALTHSSYNPNRVTNSYEVLEFLGDAILDFLITSCIYETCENLNPGQLTDLRSALVNNNTFASLTVRCGFHKYLLYINTKLQDCIDKFVKFQEHRNHVIDDEVLILLEENDMFLAEHVDVPKVLGDLFEALVGAVYLDCGKDLSIVWKVFYKIMWKEIDLFSKNVPKNVVRRLYEMPGAHPFFHQCKEVPGDKSMMKLEFMVNGVKTIVHGFGDNKADAKRAAAKIALRVLQA